MLRFVTDLLHNVLYNKVDGKSTTSCTAQIHIESDAYNTSAASQHAEVLSSLLYDLLPASPQQIEVAEFGPQWSGVRLCDCRPIGTNVFAVILGVRFTRDELDDWNLWDLKSSSRRTHRRYSAVYVNAEPIRAQLIKSSSVLPLCFM